VVVVVVECPQQELVEEKMVRAVECLQAVETLLPLFPSLASKSSSRPNSVLALCGQSSQQSTLACGWLQWLYSSSLHGLYTPCSTHGHQKWSSEQHPVRPLLLMLLLLAPPLLQLLPLLLLARVLLLVLVLLARLLLRLRLVVLLLLLLQLAAAVLFRTTTTGPLSATAATSST
jgi:hypothetical protein